jgi:hypothetical protein
MANYRFPTNVQVGAGGGGGSRDSNKEMEARTYSKLKNKVMLVWVMS